MFVKFKFVEGEKLGDFVLMLGKLGISLYFLADLKSMKEEQLMLKLRR